MVLFPGEAWLGPARDTLGAAQSHWMPRSSQLTLQSFFAVSSSRPRGDTYAGWQSLSSNQKAFSLEKRSCVLNYYTAITWEFKSTEEMASCVFKKKENIFHSQVITDECRTRSEYTDPGWRAFASSVTFASNHAICAQMICSPFSSPPSRARCSESRAKALLPLELALQAPGQLAGEEHVGQLAVAVGQAAVVAPLPVQIVEADAAAVVSQGGHVHDAGGGTLLQTLQQQEGQEKMA
ncbi:hypothetical protein EK904_009566 [Melospiza melodia maxima]|nr:hypothetical protein EK904_009566 [Melospiza melodia maxima]